jgi:DNA-binding HxlR family transcriptional regulator
MSTIRLTGKLDPRSGWKASRCSIARALDHVGARSTLLLLREAFYGTTRFDDFAERVGLSESVTAARLRELVDEGLLERQAYRDPGQRTRYEYRLTPKGAELLPALAALMQWGDRWLTENGGPVELRHHGCGERVTVALQCAAGHQVEEDELELGLATSQE